MGNKIIMKKNWRHVADPNTKEFYHLDQDFKVWTCDCMQDANHRVSLCLTLTDALKEEGELNELRRQVAQTRKELGFLQTETLEEGYKRLLQDNEQNRTREGAEDQGKGSQILP